MRRTDREITDREAIADILARCDTLCVAFAAEGEPYAVPVSFGLLEEDGALFVCFHGAAEGKKAELLEKRPRVCLEGHIFHGVEAVGGGITARYESVIAFGTAQRVPEEKRAAALRSITEHYGFADYPVGACKSLPRTAVYSVRIDSMTGKRNLRETPAPQK